MKPDALAIYVEAFAARLRATGPGALPITGPGLFGAWRGGGVRLSLLIDSDRSLERLPELLSRAEHGSVLVAPAAAGARALLAADRRWSARPVAGMICRDLDAVPDVALDPALVLAEVAAEEPPAGHGLGLGAAARVAVDAEPEAGISAECFIEELRELRPRPTFLAGVDGSGVPRATAAFQGFERIAYIFLVDTAHTWRRRGIGRAMTAAALQRARHEGAAVAYLNASDLGASVYRSLGFEGVGPLTQFRMT